MLNRADVGLKTIPSGLKENVYFITDNEANKNKKENEQRSVFPSKTSVRDTDFGMSPKTPYLFLQNGLPKKIYLRKKERPIVEC